jgi:class 3 adenylate cyclase/pimeloyl-ACP methyl ester carboxylesterase
VETPIVKYAQRKGRVLAYQTHGVGNIQNLSLGEWPANADSVWEHPSHLRIWRLLGSLGRLVRFDRSGVGSSDPDPEGWADPAVWAEDALAVMDEVGAGRVAVTAEGWSTHAALNLAARHPERVSRLVLLNGYARWLPSDSYPIDVSDSRSLATVGDYVRSRWGTGAVSSESLPTILDEDHEWWARYERAAASPSTAASMALASIQSDVTDVLDHIACPTVVVYTNDLAHVTEEACRYLAEHISGAGFLPVRSDLYYDLSAEAGQSLVAFLTGAIEPPWGDRQLAAVVFSDIVSSTEHVARHGDHEWIGVLSDYQQVVEREVKRFGGSIVKQTGDGHLMTFTSPGAAVSAAVGIRRTMRNAGLLLRFGLHMGEVESAPGGDIAGITVNTAARISAYAGPDQIVVSSVVADLLAGTGLELTDLGSHELKGVPRQWRLYALSQPALPDR